MSPVVQRLSGAQDAIIGGCVDGHVEHGGDPGDQEVVADQDDGLDDLPVVVVRTDRGELLWVELP